MSYREYLADTSATSDELLRHWRWRVDARLESWRVTKWGDALLRDRGDGAIHLLDTSDGDVICIAESVAAFEDAIADVELQDEWLRAALVDRQAMLGIRPGKDQCLGFKVPPMIGGSLEPENIEVQPVATHFALAGSLLEQLTALPPGTAVSRFRVAEPPKPWWRFWR